MPAAVAIQQTFTASATAPRAERDPARELWLALPKGGKTLGGSDENFLKQAGFRIADKVDRIDDYRLEDGPEFAQVGVRAFDMKPQMALALMAKGRLDAAVVGRDVLKEFNNGKRGKKGVAQAVEVVDLDVAPCALVIAVPEGDAAQTAADMNGRVIVTKYPELLKNWARANNVTFGEIVSSITDDDAISGGIESYSLFDPRVSAICDMVESGESLVRYNLKPLGINDTDWQPVREDVLAGRPKKERRKFTDMAPEAMNALPGLVINSSAVLVRAARKMSPEKETAFKTLSARFADASRAMGRSPAIKEKRVAQQNQKKPVARSPRDTGQEIGHGWRNRLG